jgi:hypothetical protein
LTALVFIGRGSGIRVLPLLVLQDDANGTVGGGEAGDGNDGVEGGVAGRNGVGNHGYNADADQRGAGAEEQIAGHGEVFQGPAAVLEILPLNAAPLPVQAPAAAAAPDNPAVLHLQRLYGGLLRKRQLVQQLVRQLSDMAERARAEGTRLDRKETRTLIDNIVEHIGGVKRVKGDITELLAVIEGDAAPAPPAEMEEDPEEWVPDSVRRRLRRGG